MTAAVEHVRDRLGLPVDAGIRDVVVGLNLLHLPTLQSCEGLVSAKGHGLPAPWVDFIDDPNILARAEGLLDQLHAGSTAPAADPRLVLEGERERLGNGSGFQALNAVRNNLAEGRLAPAEIDALRRQLGLRQQEMQRFAIFLRARVLETA